MQDEQPLTELEALIAQSAAEAVEAVPPEESLAALRELAEKFRELKDHKDQLNDELKKTSRAIEEVSADIKKLMEIIGSTSMRLPGIGLIYQQTDPNPQIYDIEGFIQWADDHGYTHLAKRTVHGGTARSFWKEQLESGGELPPAEIASAFFLTQVRLRRA